jgi:hypothetical protein
VLGAYGLTIELPDAEPVLGPADSSWPTWAVLQLKGSEAADEFIGPDNAAKPYPEGGCTLVDRRTNTTTFVLPELRPADLIVHPMLSFTAVVAARWSGAQSFHAGAFVLDGGAWGVLGRKGAGKSTLLATVAAHGYPVVCDDVLVVRGRTCLAGPRAIDLREGVAPRFPQASFRGVINGRERWRLPLPETPAEIPLHGWLALEWGPRSIAPLGPGERFGLLAESLAVRLPPPDPSALFDLATLPMLSVGREPDLQQMDSLIGVLTSGIRRACAASSE